MNIDNHADFMFAYVTTVAMELYYLLDDPLLLNHPLYKQNIKNQIKTTYRVLEDEIVNKYFGVKKTKGKYGEATADSQINLFENIKMLEKYHKSALLLNDEDRDVILNIIKKYE